MAAHVTTRATYSTASSGTGLKGQASQMTRCRMPCLSQTREQVQPTVLPGIAGGKVERKMFSVSKGLASNIRPVSDEREQVQPTVLPTLPGSERASQLGELEGPHDAGHRFWWFLRFWWYGRRGCRRPKGPRPLRRWVRGPPLARPPKATKRPPTIARGAPRLEHAAGRNAVANGL